MTEARCVKKAQKRNKCANESSSSSSDHPSTPPLSWSSSSLSSSECESDWLSSSSSDNEDASCYAFGDGHHSDTERSCTEGSRAGQDEETDASIAPRAHTYGWRLNVKDEYRCRALAALVLERMGFRDPGVPVPRIEGSMRHSETLRKCVDDEEAAYNAELLWRTVKQIAERPERFGIDEEGPSGKDKDKKKAAQVKKKTTKKKCAKESGEGRERRMKLEVSTAGRVAARLAAPDPGPHTSDNDEGPPPAWVWGLGRSTVFDAPPRGSDASMADVVGLMCGGIASAAVLEIVCRCAGRERVLGLHPECERPVWIVRATREIANPCRPFQPSDALVIPYVCETAARQASSRGWFGWSTKLYSVEEMRYLAKGASKGIATVCATERQWYHDNVIPLEYALLDADMPSRLLERNEEPTEWRYFPILGPSEASCDRDSSDAKGREGHSEGKSNGKDEGKGKGKGKGNDGGEKDFSTVPSVRVVRCDGEWRLSIGEYREPEGAIKHCVWDEVCAMWVPWGYPFVFARDSDRVGPPGQCPPSERGCEGFGEAARMTDGGGEGEGESKGKGAEESEGEREPTGRQTGEDEATAVPWSSWKEKERKWDDDATEKRVRGAWALAIGHLLTSKASKGKRKHKPRWLTLGVPNDNGFDIPLAFAPLPDTAPSDAPQAAWLDLSVPTSWRRVRDIGIDHGLIRHHVAKYDERVGRSRGRAERGSPWEIKHKGNRHDNDGEDRHDLVSLRDVCGLMATLARKGFCINAWLGRDPPHGEWQPRRGPAISGSVGGSKGWALPIIALHKPTEGDMPAMWWRHVYTRLIKGDLLGISEDLGCPIDSCRRVLPLTYLVIKRITSIRRLLGHHYRYERVSKHIATVMESYQAVLARFVLTMGERAGGTTGGSTPKGGTVSAGRVESAAKAVDLLGHLGAQIQEVIALLQTAQPSPHIHSKETCRWCRLDT